MRIHQNVLWLYISVNLVSRLVQELQPEQNLKCHLSYDFLFHEGNTSCKSPTDIVQKISQTSTVHVLKSNLHTTLLKIRAIKVDLGIHEISLPESSSAPKD